jgi:hypothetical protein
MMNGITPTDEDILKAAIGDFDKSTVDDVNIYQSKPNKNHKYIRLVFILIGIFVFSVFAYAVLNYDSNYNQYESSLYNNDAEEITDDGNQLDNERYIFLEETAANEIANLYDELSLDNAIQCFYVYCTLLQDGNFSKGDYVYNDDNLCDYEYALGYDILLGKGVCKNIDDLFRLSMEKAGYDIKSTTSSCESNFNDITSDEANHQVSIINENGDVYALDVTNGVVLDNYSNEFAIYYDYDGNIYNLILPECSIEENGYLASHNTQNEVDLINKWMANDCNSLDADYINSQQQYVYELLSKSSTKEVIKDFDLDYYNNVLSQIN